MRAAWWLVGLMACSGGGDEATDTVEDSEQAEQIDTDDLLPEPANVKAYSGEACPEMSDGVVEMESAGLDRSFVLHLPSDQDELGLLVAWHGNGDSAANFDAAIGGAALADALGVAVIVPEAGAGGIATDWGVPPTGNPNFDITFFDDMIACMAEQHTLDRRRVYAAGFSGGALWTSYLTMNRARYLAATAIFSGGTDGPARFNPYSSPGWAIPVLMTHGGQSDVVVVQFQTLTNNMASKLRADGSTVIVCAHGGGHTIPAGYQDWLRPFLSAHRYGMSPGPYADGNDPSGELPAYCSWE
jgi:predicted esterase